MSRTMKEVSAELSEAHSKELTRMAKSRQLSRLAEEVQALCRSIEQTAWQVANTSSYEEDTVYEAIAADGLKKVIQKLKAAENEL